jgi:nucleoside-diphosphate-sugar epimerase
MRSNFSGLVNIGSDEMVTIDRLVDLVAEIAGKTIKKRHIDGPTGVRGRNSDNRLIREKLNWSPSTVLVDGLRPTYEWINAQVKRNARHDGEELRVSASALKQSTLTAAK